MVEDDEEIAQLLSIYLQQFGFSIENFTSPMEGLEALKNGSFDLLILDLSLPQIDGLELLKEIRYFSNIPVIISSARGSVTDKVSGLELGADDYLPKPYEPIELVARIKAVLKRSWKETQPIEDFGEFSIDLEKFEIRANGELLHLTKGEFEVLKYMLESRGKVLSREAIAENADSIHWDSVDRTVDVIVSRVRTKLGDTPKNPKYIRSVRGVGYQFL
jgi:two-component system OmpR family response regulator